MNTTLYLTLFLPTIPHIRFCKCLLYLNEVCDSNLFFSPFCLVFHSPLKKLTDNNTGHGMAPGMNEIMSSLQGWCSDWN